MTRPSIFTYLVGNGLSALLLNLGWVGFTIAYFSSGASPLLAILCFLAGAYALKANERIRAFNNWQREWNAMGETAAPSRSRVPTIRVPWRLVAGGVIWLALALASLGLANEPAMVVPVLLFWVGSGMLAAAWWMRRRAKGTRHARGETVEVCLVVPVDAGLNASYSCLPAHLQRLICGR